MTEGNKVCELCREHSGLKEHCRNLDNRCDYFDALLKPDGVIFKEIAKVRKWIIYFLGGILLTWVINTGLTYKAANNTEKVAEMAAAKAVEKMQQLSK